MKHTKNFVKHAAKAVEHNDREAFEALVQEHAEVRGAVLWPAIAELNRIWQESDPVFHSIYHSVANLENQEAKEFVLKALTQLDSQHEAMREKIETLAKKGFK